jgi:hypothetical protein
VGFVLGFPALVTLALHRRYKAVAFLAKDYKGGDVQRMWEVVDLVRKLLLSSAVLFMPEGSIERIAIALLISVTSQVLQVYYPVQLARTAWPTRRAWRSRSRTT